jgi:hypothetical protein
LRRLGTWLARVGTPSQAHLRWGWGRRASTAEAETALAESRYVCDNLRTKLRQLQQRKSERLAQRAAELFQSADTDGNGWLSHTEVR